MFDLELTSAGERLMPLNPLAGADATGTTQTNITGAGTIADVICVNEGADRGNNYNPVTGIYTVPITGLYMVFFHCVLNNVTAAMTEAMLGWQINAADLSSANVANNPGANRDANSTWAAEFYVILSLTAADTLLSQVQVSNGAGDTADLNANSVVLFNLLG